MLTIDHGFNASTFTARVVASTGADLADCVCAALGALAGPLHGGAPGRALDALDAIGSTRPAAEWVRAEVAAGRRIMGFGHAVYRSVDPRSVLLRAIAEELGGELVERAIAVEAEILATLAELKPDRELPSNVEYYAGVVMASAGVPREMFTPTFAVSRTVGLVPPRRRAGGDRQADPPRGPLHRPPTPEPVCPRRSGGPSGADSSGGGGCWRGLSARTKRGAIWRRQIWGSGERGCVPAVEGEHDRL